MPIWQALDPRRSLGAGVIWLVVALAAVFSIAATVWVGRIARDSVIAQHKRRLSLETDQLSSAVTQAVAQRLSAIRVTETLLHGTVTTDPEDALRRVFAELRSAYPQLDWVALADANGAVIEDVGTARTDASAWSRRCLKGGLEGPRIVGTDDDRHSGNGGMSETSSLGGMAAPVHDASGDVIGVICARLSWRRTENHPQRLTDETDRLATATAYVLDRHGVVLMGPPEMLGHTWPGTHDSRAPNFHADPTGGSQLERLPNGGEVLVARELVSLAPEYPALSWLIQLSEPRDRAYQRADLLAVRILWASSSLAGLTALLGIIGARQLTHRLRHLTNSVTAAGQGDLAEIDVPRGSDEVAQLGAAFSTILGALHRERRELERRVAVRTREVERLAEDARYAAIVRERLNIARDLHDTLAHSMMAILSEIRYLRRLSAHEPHSVAEELARAEEVAHEGLKEARSAITQMRVSTVRETGLGDALAREVERVVTRTGIAAELSIEPEAGRFADERAEILLRMAQEVIRNIERHSLATAVVLKLRILSDHRLNLVIEDNGVGFDPSAEVSGHYGIVGLREQAELIGAALQLDSTPNRGTHVRIDVPLAPVTFK
jgi:signal transduction histidine kinase